METTSCRDSTEPKRGGIELQEQFQKIAGIHGIDDASLTSWNNWFAGRRVTAQQQHQYGDLYSPQNEGRACGLICTGWAARVKSKCVTLEQ